VKGRFWLNPNVQGALFQSNKMPSPMEKQTANFNNQEPHQAQHSLAPRFQRPPFGPLAALLIFPTPLFLMGEQRSII
jgi:hypothetical protein